MTTFDQSLLEKLAKRSESPDNGQVTIIGGSDLFHGAPILAIKTASRIVDMVFFSSPEPSLGEIANNLKSQLSSFIWVPWEEIGEYIKKSDAVLIGPGMKRWHKEQDNGKYLDQHVSEYDEAGTQTKFIVEKFLREFPDKQWVIDGGALQVVDIGKIPQNAVITPNRKEFALLFRNDLILAQESFDEQIELVLKTLKSHRFGGIVVLKGPTAIVAKSFSEYSLVSGGNNGLTKGGTGDLLAGLIAGLAARNDPYLAAQVGDWALKRAADNTFGSKGTMYNADDIAEELPQVLGKYLK